jgi:hypothetical protein
MTKNILSNWKERNFSNIFWSKYIVENMDLLRSIYMSDLGMQFRREIAFHRLSLFTQNADENKRH